MEECNTNYSTLIDFLDNAHEKDTEGKNHSDILLSMQNSTSIKELVCIYDKVFKRLVRLTYGEDESRFPSYWYKPVFWMENRGYLAEELDNYLNCNILRLLKNNLSKSNELFIACLLNIRNGSNKENTQRELFSLCNDFSEDNVNEFIKIRDDYYATINEFEKVDVGTAAYKELHKKYSALIKRLSKNGYKKSIREKAFENEKGIFNTKLFLIITSIIIISSIISLIMFGKYVFIIFIAFIMLNNMVFKGKIF